MRATKRHLLTIVIEFYKVKFLNILEQLGVVSVYCIRTRFYFSPLNVFLTNELLHSVADSYDQDEHERKTVQNTGAKVRSRGENKVEYFLAVD